ncbi:hypothetical protein ACFE04_004573 [Oxalis oulophora]
MSTFFSCEKLQVHKKYIFYGALEPISGVEIPPLTDEEQNEEHKIEDDYVFQDPCPCPDKLYQWAPNQELLKMEGNRNLNSFVVGNLPTLIASLVIKNYSKNMRGVMIVSHHQDGPAYFLLAAILSLGSPAEAQQSMVLMMDTPPCRRDPMAYFVKSSSKKNRFNDLPVLDIFVVEKM